MSQLREVVFSYCWLFVMFLAVCTFSSLPLHSEMVDDAHIVVKTHKRQVASKPPDRESNCHSEAHETELAFPITRGAAVNMQRTTASWLQLAVQRTNQQTNKSFLNAQLSQHYFSRRKFDLNNKFMCTKCMCARSRKLTYTTHKYTHMDVCY